MRPLAPMLAVLLVGPSPTARAQPRPTRATGGNPAAAMQRAMQQEMRQQQQMIQQQQRAMQQQQKAMEQRQKAMLQQQQKAMEQRQKAMLQQQQKAMQPHAAANATAGNPTPGSASSAHEAQANHGAKAGHGATSSHAANRAGVTAHGSNRHWLRAAGPPRRPHRTGTSWR